MPLRTMRSGCAALRGALTCAALLVLLGCVAGERFHGTNVSLSAGFL